MAFNFNMISTTIAEQGRWCGVAIFMFSLWIINFILHMFRIKECQGLKKRIKKLKEIVKRKLGNGEKKE